MGLLLQVVVNGFRAFRLLLAYPYTGQSRCQEKTPMELACYVTRPSDLWSE